MMALWNWINKWYLTRYNHHHFLLSKHFNNHQELEKRFNNFNASCSMSKWACLIFFLFYKNSFEWGNARSTEIQSFSLKLIIILFLKRVLIIVTKTKAHVDLITWTDLNIKTGLIVDTMPDYGRLHSWNRWENFRTIKVHLLI